ncbi:hypothetical protein B0G76_1319 [Paraburkholderia sp. BL23I1N1]|uniref:hypothetical protein n=1 Tax=Paraburkholderia sp. BL23I1N1 TaxID=1938802 RepID=UPI000E73DA82|nr:hypothetical protein [Paraburkholderia sp. BL23I1N1]RKE35258.1 hypothetical protein B0G76_1319 [Paraburkholderia sp. BL23I1N1]
MSEEKTSLSVELPTPEAADLAVRAAQEGVSTPDLLGYHVLRSAYGLMHPKVLAFETRPKSGQAGNK